MKKAANLALIAILSIAATNCEQAGANEPETRQPAAEGRAFYQLKTYTFLTEDEVKATDQYLEAAFLPGLKRLGITTVGVFKLRTNETDTIQKTFVLIPFTSMEQFLTLEEKLAQDEEYLTAGQDYINASHEEPPYQRIESTLLKAFTDMPKMQTPKLEGPRSQRVYELRSYESPTEQYYRNKVDMFNAGGEVALFDKLGFNAVFYGEVLSGSRMPNLMYMTTFSDMESRKAHWETFVNSPEWKALSAMPKYQNNVSHADIMLLYPTEYSDY